MERLLTPYEAAEFLRVKRSTLYTWAYRRVIPSVKVGGALRFSPSALDRWVNRRPAGNATERVA
jgi:excisionase family DNA binding protein